MEEKIDYKIKYYFSIALTFFKDYYAPLSAVAALLFTMLCLNFSNIYLSEFSINAFSFISISDAYLISLSNEILTKSVSIVLIIISFFVFFITSLNSLIKDLKNDYKLYKKKSLFKSIAERSKPIIAVIVTSLSFLGVTFTAPLIVVNSATNEANKIKEGFSPRYTIFESNNKYKCYSVIGSSSDYLLTWDHKKEKSVVLSKSIVKKLEQTVYNSPAKKVIKRKQSDELYEQQKEELKSKQIAWSALLKTQCAESVKWPD